MNGRPVAYQTSYLKFVTDVGVTRKFQGGDVRQTILEQFFHVRLRICWLMDFMFEEWKHYGRT